MNKFALGGAIAALTLALAPAANATVFNLGPPGSNFYIAAGTPTSPSITAFFSNTISSSPFSDSFSFTIPQNGIGSGSLSTSFSSVRNQLTITDVKINGVSYASSLANTVSGQSLVVGGIAISKLVPNLIEVFGTGKGLYTGTATFSAVPESSTWAMMILGLGAAGFAARRRRKITTRVAYA